ncbi:MAG: histidinol dehydrogenase [Desulfobacteraceae bacterium]|jgi:histidinol dehydrogenase|nr:histidinol dehydrogenase [Desulfobacteraceae bacterium]
MDNPIRFHDLDKLSETERHTLLKRTESDLSRYIESVESILKAVKEDGDLALVRFAREFDQAEIKADAIKVQSEEFEKAFESVEADVVEAIRFAADSIRVFHEGQLPEPMRMNEVRPGVFCGEKVNPIPSVACYVPRGKGSFPSVVLMTTIPAVVAGVPKVCILTPPGPDGRVDDATLVAARQAGVEEIYKSGGAQAVAAAAYGTATIPKFDKIVGPGSPWVMAAKRLLADEIDPGIPAGPSESIVFADHTADGRLAALDLIIESEHGPDSSAFLVTNSREVAEKALEAIPNCWQSLGETRKKFSTAVLGGPHGGVVLALDEDACIRFINDYAPEHLMIHSGEPFKYLGAIKHAGEILLGRDTPITLGNYLLGPNAVLPTSGAARIHSPLGVRDFLKTTGIGYVTSGAYDLLAKHAHTLAVYEGFDGHALAVSELRKKIISKD